MIKALNAGLDVSRDPFAEFSFLSQDGKGSLGRGSSFVARDEVFAVLAGRIGIKTHGIDLSQLRVEPKLAETYTIEQFGAWQNRKTVNDEAHQDSRKKFQALPADVQENVARLAEMRLVVLKLVLTSAGLSAYLKVGQELKDQLATQYGGDHAKLLGEIRSELEEKIANGKPLTVDRIERQFTALCGPVKEDFTSYSDLLLRIHHGLWHSNLEKAHEFAYRMDNLPTDPVIDPANPAKSRPQGLRSFSDKANLLNILGQLVAFSNAIEAHPEQKLVAVPGEKQGTTVSMVVPRMGSTVRDLDAKAVINN
jgi:hypothetical protein